MMPAAGVALALLLAQANAADGAAYAAQACAPCHSFVAGGRSTLYGVIGPRRWRLAALEQALREVGRLHAGHPTIARDETRADLLDYLRGLSPHPVAWPAGPGASRPATHPGPPPRGRPAPPPPVDWHDPDDRG